MVAGKSNKEIGVALASPKAPLRFTSVTFCKSWRQAGERKPSAWHSRGVLLAWI